MMISIVIPTHNDAAHLPGTLAPLVQGVGAGLVKQVIIADGGSTDATLEIAEAAGCDIVSCEAGRGKQMRAGVEASRANWLLLLHPDTSLSLGWVAETERFMSGTQARKRAAAFRLAIDDDSGPAKQAMFWARLRAEVMKMPSGDQGLLISRLLYDALGGYPDLPMMADVEMARRIGRKRLFMLQTQAVISAEACKRAAYDRHGFRSVGLMTRYLLGADPAELAKAQR